MFLTADCNALDSCLGQKDAPRFSSRICCDGCAAPVFKKIPAFFLFAVIWLAVVINIAKPLSSKTDEQFSPLVFRNFSKGVWASKPYVNWIPGGRRVLEDEYSVFADCQKECNRTRLCTAFLVQRTDRYSSSSGDCYLWEDGAIPSLEDPDLIESCRYPCTTYIKSTTSPFLRESLDWQPSYASPFHPGNQGATQPLYYACVLCIAMITVDCIVYWTFFTLSVPAGRLFRLIFFATMVGSLVCGAFIASWVDKESICPSYLSSSYYSSSYYSIDYEGLVAPNICTPNQRLLKDAAIGSAVVLILMGAWPVLALPWTIFSIIVAGALVGLYSLIMQADFVKIWTYVCLAEWLVWQKDEQGQSLTAERARKAGAPPPRFDQSKNSSAGLTGGIMHMNEMKTENSELIKSLQRENEALTNQALANDAVSARLREENAKLRMEIATLKLNARPPASFTLRKNEPSATYTPVSAPSKVVYDETPHYEAPPINASAYTAAAYTDPSMLSPPPYDPYASVYGGGTSSASGASTYGSDCGSSSYGSSSYGSSYGSSAYDSSSYGNQQD